jgi:hypothetical protein
MRTIRRNAVALGAVFFALAAVPNAFALPYLTVENARHVLEERFAENEEQLGNETYTLDNCYRVSATHVNCYAEAYTSANACQVQLWRAFETAIPHESKGPFVMHTRGQYWEECPE